MGRKTTLRDLLGVLKDKASLSKAALLSKPSASSLNLAVLRATTHQPSSLPQEKHVTILLSFGESSRNVASTCIEALMDRLHKTQNSSVVFKCLITIHIIIRRGSFILQDQLSIYPATGGRNYLNLSNFRDNSTPDSWNLSSWVRWYARVLESLLLTSRILGFFFSDKEDEHDAVSALLNMYLLKEIDVLVSLIEEVCSAPELMSNNKIVHQAMSLVGQDCSSAQNELFIRINETRVRIDSLSFADSVELICVLRRLESCKERMESLFLDKKGSIGDKLWCLVKDMKEKIATGNEYSDGRLVPTGRKVGFSESARLGERVVRPVDSFLFSSGRLKLEKIPTPIPEYIKSGW